MSTKIGPFRIIESLSITVTVDENDISNTVGPEHAACKITNHCQRSKERCQLWQERQFTARHSAQNVHRTEAVSKRNMGQIGTSQNATERIYEEFIATEHSVQKEKMKMEARKVEQKWTNAREQNEREVNAKKAMQENAAWKPATQKQATIKHGTCKRGI